MAGHLRQQSEGSHPLLAFVDVDHHLRVRGWIQLELRHAFLVVLGFAPHAAGGSWVEVAGIVRWLEHEAGLDVLVGIVDAVVATWLKCVSSPKGFTPGSSFS